MTGRLEIDFAILTEKLQQVSDQIEPYGKVSDFLENEKVRMASPNRPKVL